MHDVFICLLYICDLLVYLVELVCSCIAASSWSLVYLYV
jgi:hypothetical protein